MQHIRREERRQRRPEANVLDAKVQQGQQDAHGLLLVPREHHGQRQLVHAAAERVGQREGDLNGAVGVVALPDVHQTRQTGDRAEVEVVEAEFSAGEGQHDGVGRGLLHEFGVIIAAGTRAVAARDQEKVPDRAGFHGPDHLLRRAEHRAAREAGRDRAAAVDAGEDAVGGIAAQRERLFDDRGEVLVRADVGDPRIGHRGRGEHAVGVARLRRHQAVRREQHRRRQVGEFALLVLPRRAEIALEVRVFFQRGIAVGGQHLAVGIDVDALARSLLEQKLQIAQIMAGDHDERPFFHGQRNGNRHRITVMRRIGAVEHRHAAQILLADLHHDRQKLVHAPVLADGEERLGEKVVHGRVGLAEHHGVVGVGRHPTHAEEDQRLEAADVLLRAPELRHVIVAGSPARGGAQGAVRHEPRFFRVHPVDQRADGVGIEAHVGDGREQPLDHQPPSAVVHGRGVVRRPCQTDQRARQLVLKPRHVGAFAADACIPGAAGAAGRLFALKTKHLLLHVCASRFKGFRPECARPSRASRPATAGISRFFAGRSSPRVPAHRSRALPCARR